MHKLLIPLASVVALVAVPGTVQALDTTTPGTSGGAAPGAIVTGANDGALVGGVLPNTIAHVPPEVTTYVIAQKVPSVKVERVEIAAGQQLPTELTVYPVDVDPTYAYTVVNDRHVIIDARTRVVIGFVEQASDR